MRSFSRLIVGPLTALAALAPLAHAQCEPAQLPAASPYTGVKSLTLYHGELIAAGDGFRRQVVRWDGTIWRLMHEARSIQAMTVYRDNLIVGGAERWDGAAWRPLDDEIPNHTVFTMLPFNDDLILAGTLTAVGTLPANRIVRWNGTDWLAMGAGLDDEVHALAVYKDELIAGGAFTTSGGRSVNHVARWDGAEWRPLGAGIDGLVTDFALYNGELIAGGFFFSADGVAANSIARWDGVSWRPLGEGLLPRISFAPPVVALTTYRGLLIAGGHLRTAGGLPADYIAAWDGEAWHPLPSDLDNGVLALIVHEHQLIAGGAFSKQLARWACAPCTTDLDSDGQIDYSDVLAFVSIYDAGDLDADLNQDGLVDRSDWLLFLEAYSAGC